MNKRTRNLALVASLAAVVVVLDRWSAAEAPQAAASATAPSAATPTGSPAPSATRPASVAASPAQGSSAVPPGAGAGAGAETGASEAERDRPPRRLAERLRKHGPETSSAQVGLVDPFEPRPAPVSTEPTAREATPAVAAVDVAAFLRRRPLAAVLGDGASVRAVVAGEVLRVGDVREGMEVAAIGRRHVVWSGGGLRFAAGLHAAGGRATGLWTPEASPGTAAETGSQTSPADPSSADPSSADPPPPDADAVDPVAALFDR